MRIALLMHPYNLGFRGKWTWDDLYNDPRGMSGSELGFVEIGKQLAGMGHQMDLFTDTEASLVLGDGLHVYPWTALVGRGISVTYDLAIAINHPGGLEHFDCPKILFQWLNSHEYIHRAEYEQVDLWLSPSEAHREFILSTGKHELADAVVDCDPAKWSVLPLGCTPELYSGIEKVPGRVIYASSPDRGLHHLLQAWSAIKARVPHAHLKIYYRILPWIAEMKSIPEPFPPCEENRQRALYIEDALRRLSDPKWGVEVVGPVSRNGVTRAMGEAECLAYPVDTMRFSEGFSVTTLEGCAAGSCPVVFDCDAIGSIYGGVAEVVPRGDVDGFADRVVRALSDPDFRGSVNQRCMPFSRNLSWSSITRCLLEKSQALLGASKPDSKSLASAGSGPSSGTTRATGKSASETL